MKRFKIKHLVGVFVCALLLLVISAPLFFTSCENEHPEINITLESDFSGIIEAINNTNKTLVEKLAAIETAISNGFATQSEAQDLIKQALESLNGTLEDKLDAIEEAISSQTTSLEAKLGLIEVAIDGGFADQAAAQDLIKQAIDSLSGTMADKLAAIKEAITSQTTSLESKLALIETAINNGFAGQLDALDLIQEAVESLEGTVEEKLAAIETAVNNQTTSLETKLGLIETAINSGFTNQEQALGLIKDAILTLKDSVDGLDDAIDDVVDAIDGVADTIGDTNDALDEIADALNDIIDSIDDIPDYSEILAAIQAAISSLRPGDEEENTINGYEYVEMGDGLRWATMNIGATAPEVIGDYFCWGMTEPITSPQGQFEGSPFEPPVFEDAATAIMGDSWRLPSKEEFERLLNPDEFNWTVETINGVKGFTVTSKISGYEGNHIFLPGAGWYMPNSGVMDSVDGYYWSSTFESTSGPYYMAHCLYIYDNYSSCYTEVSSQYRGYGLPIRAVSEVEEPIPDPNNIVFVDPNVKGRLLRSFDTNGDGEISYAEAAAVTNEDFVMYFYNGSSPGPRPPQITSFDELQYFTGLTTIPEGCFYWCTSLQSITLPSTVTSIGQYAFYGCSGIREFVFPATVNSFGYNSLQGFGFDRLVFLAEDLTIGPDAFFPNIKELVFYAKEPPFKGQHVQGGSPGPFPFQGERIMVPADAIYRYEEVWYQQKRYLEMIPETVEEPIVFVDPAVKTKLVNAFDANSDGELSYGEAAAVTSDQMAHFFENSGITSFDEFKYFRGLTSVPEDCFKGCTNLTSIIIPTAVQSLEAGAFDGCSSLEDLFFKESLNNVASRALAGCTGLKSLKFYSCPALDHPFGNPAENLPLLESMYIYSFGLPVIDENTLNIPTSCVLFVSDPNNLQTLDVWSGYASQMQKIPDWEMYWRTH